MASRQQEKERLRQRRLAAEQAERARQKRRLVIGYASAGILVALIVAGIVIAVTNSGGGTNASDIASQTEHEGSVPAAAEQGLRTTPPPWPPLYKGLAGRIGAMGLPKLNENIYHVHSWLHVYVDGRPVPVPRNVGLDELTGTFSSMHTHYAAVDGVRDLPAGAGDGIIHMEADTPYAYTLGQFFAVWGVRFTDNQLGPYKAGNGKVLEVYFNGQRVADPVNAVLHEHTDISVGYGKPGSFPKKPPVNWPTGL
jgi:hypothetical protein